MPAEAFLVGAVGRRGSRSAVDRRATRRVGDHHAVAVELRDRLDVWRFAAAGARSGELEQRPGELAVLDGFRFVDHGILVADLVVHVFPALGFALVELASSGFISRALVGAGADVRAVAAARTVERRYLNLEPIGFRRSDALFGFGACRAAAASSSVSRNGRIAACGQT